MGRYLDIARSVVARNQHQESRPAAPASVIVESVSPQPGRWSKESLDCERRFDRPYAKLFPLIGGTVWTPLGVGILEQVFADRAAVTMPGSRKMTFLSPDRVLPVN